MGESGSGSNRGLLGLPADEEDADTIIPDEFRLGALTYLGASLEPLFRGWRSRETNFICVIHTQEFA